MQQPTDLTPTLAEASPPMPLEQVPPELRDERSTLEKIKAADAARPGFPGEHWLVLGLGVALWQFTRKHRSWAVRTAGGLAASALVARAASGREGLSRVLRYTPLGRGIRSAPLREAPAASRQPQPAYPFPTARSMGGRA
ncbi:MAG TPA: hypothetical protein VFM98_11395 [Ramlibacter sp.]|uniref:hypothetical protein n=1 Tax=Ramlibacter sp. TaxID=1917967 RepID=UPI002D7FEFCF|nr:hypothetical protein [Ramlibacter sp.]HET8746201.1 hypothetical protein [Ramlibacter sp.]